MFAKIVQLAATGIKLVRAVWTTVCSLDGRTGHWFRDNAGIGQGQNDQVDREFLRKARCYSMLSASPCSIINYPANL